MAPARKSSLVFDCGGVLYGLPVERALEVFRLASLTRVPGCPLHVLGLVAHRADLVPVVDLSALSGGTVGSYRLAVLVRLPEDPLALGVTRVVGVFSTAVPPSAEAASTQGSFFGGHATCEAGDVLLIDLDALAAALLAGQLRVPEQTGSCGPQHAPSSAAVGP